MILFFLLGAEDLVVVAKDNMPYSRRFIMPRIIHEGAADEKWKWLQGRSMAKHLLKSAIISEEVCVIVVFYDTLDWSI